jgi:hypothetical protein
LWRRGPLLVYARLVWLLIICSQIKTALCGRATLPRHYSKRIWRSKGAKKIHAKTEIDAGPENWEEERPAARWTAIEY